MKWVYRIFRLFFCPHNWTTKGTREINNVRTGSVAGLFIQQQCKHCGKIKFVEGRV